MRRWRYAGSGQSDWMGRNGYRAWCRLLAPSWLRDKRSSTVGASGRGICGMPIVGALFAVVAAAIVAAWAWLGAAVGMPPAPFGAGEKLYCISYAPFRGPPSPFR